MANTFKKIKRIQQQIQELEVEYNEKNKELEERKKKIRLSNIYGDFEEMSQGDLDYVLGIVTTFDSYDRSCCFYEAFSFIWRYIENASGYVAPTEENIFSFGQYIFNDPNKLFSEEEIKKVKCGVYSLDEHLDALEQQFYVSSSEHPVYRIAAICLRLEALGFRTTYDLERECICRLANIEILKKQIRDYKIAIGETLIKGGALKAEQTVNTTVLPTIDNVIKPNISNGIKMLSKKLKKSDN